MKSRLVLSLALLANLATAQSPPTPAPAPAPEKTPVRERERTIYVPYDELEKVFNDGGKGVFLPYKEFLELWNELTLKRKEEEVKPPQDGVVSKAEYVGRVEGETMIIDAKITVESYKPGWLTVPLAKGNAVPGIAEADTGKAVLHAKPDGYDVLLPDKGVYELKLKIYAPIKKAAGRQTVSLVLPQAAVSRFTTVVPESGWEFKVEPAAAFTSRAVEANTELSFFFGSGTRFDVTWSRPDAITALQPLVLASSAITSEVRAGSLTTNATVNFRILRAPVKSFTLLIPGDQTIQSVVGDDVKDWKVEPAGEKQKLTINPNAPVKDNWSVRLALEAALPKLPAEVAVPEIIVEGATQDRGDIGIAAEPQLDVTPKPDAAMVQQTQTSAPSQGLSAVGGYRFLKHPAKLSLSVAEAKPQVDVDSLTTLTVKRDSNRVESTFNYNIRRVGVFEARVALPAGWTGWEVTGLPPDQWSVEKAGTTEVMVVKFTKQTLGRAVFSVLAQQQRANPTEDAVVPVFLPQNAARYDAKIGIGVPFSLEVNTKTAGDLRIDDVNSVGSVLLLSAGNTYSGSTTVQGGTLDLNGITQTFEQTRAKNPTNTARADTELTLAFRHRGEAKNTATLAFKARDPQVNVEVLTLMEAKEQSLRHTWTLAFDVAYAATDRFILAVPKSVAGEIRFADPSVKEVHKDFIADDKLKASLPGATQFDLWEVILRNERIGSFQLTLSVEKSIAAGAKDAQLDLLSVHVPGAFQETGQVAVLKDDSLEIRDAKDAKAENLEDIDPKELRAPLARGGVFLAYKYRSQPLKLTLDVKKNEYVAVPQAVVTQCLLTTGVSTDNAQNTEVIYWVKNNALQFLTVRLPEGASMLSDIFVNGKTQQPMKREGSSDILVRLPTGGGSAAFPVRFVFSLPSAKPGEKLGWWGDFRIAVPELEGVGVLEAHHQLYLPESYHYTKFDGPMTLSVKDRGWQSVRGMTRMRTLAEHFIPAFGPQPDAPSEAWHPIAGLPDKQRASLDVPVMRQGQSAKLHRLGPPAAIDVTFRSRDVTHVYEGIAFVLTVLLGLTRLRAPIIRKVRFLVIVTIGAVIASGMVDAANGFIPRAVLYALLLIVAIWLIVGIITGLRNMSNSVSAIRQSDRDRDGPSQDDAPSAKTTVFPPAEKTPRHDNPPEAAAAATVKPAKPPASSDLEFPKIEGQDKPESK